MPAWTRYRRVAVPTPKVRVSRHFRLNCQQSSHRMNKDDLFNQFATDYTPSGPTHGWSPAADENQQHPEIRRKSLSIVYKSSRNPGQNETTDPSLSPILLELTVPCLHNGPAIVSGRGPRCRTSSEFVCSHNRPTRVGLSDTACRAVAAGLHEAAVAKGKLYFGTATDNGELTDSPYFKQLGNTADFGQITPSNSMKASSPAYPCLLSIGLHMLTVT